MSIHVTVAFMTFAIVAVACDPGTHGPPPTAAEGHSTDERRRTTLSTPAQGALLDVVIDTDVGNEIDDQFALVYALLSPERLNVLAVYAAPFSLQPSLFADGTGTSPLDRRVLEANLATFNLTLDDLPTLTPDNGAATARREAEEVVALVAPALSDAVYEGAPAFMPDARTPVDSPAARHLIALARARDVDAKPLYVVVNGAATNTASALLLAPDITDRIVVVWTAAYPTFWPHPNASYNMAQDLHAARVLFDGLTQLVYVPGFFVAEALRTSSFEIAGRVDASGPIGGYLSALYSGQLFAGGDDKTKVIWDLATVGWLVQPEWTTHQLVRTPWLDDELRWRAGEDRPLMGEVVDLHRDAIFNDLFDKLAASRKP